MTERLIKSLTERADMEYRRCASATNTVAAHVWKLRYKRTCYGLRYLYSRLDTQ